MSAVFIFYPFLIALAVGLVFGIVIIIGAVKMMRLNSHGMATVASVLAMLPCGPAWLLGLPMGIWSLVVLNRRQVKTAFQAQARSRGGVAGVESSRPQSSVDEKTGTGPGSLPGTPLTQIRFAVDDSRDVARQAIFHFSTLGYQLIEQRPDVCVFQRGSAWAGLWETDIRGIRTILTVRTAPAAAGVLWVSCDWSVRAFGAWIFQRDIGKLEAEGRGLESLLGGGVAGVASSAETTGAGPVSLPPPRPKLVPVMAALNLCLAILLLLVYSGEDPFPFDASTPLIWRVWNQVDYVLGFALSAGLFASSIGLFLWKNWARRLLIGLCVLGLVSLVVGMPFLARAGFPHMAAEMSNAYAEAGVPPEEQPISPEAIVFVIAGACLLVGLPWLISQLVYFTRPRVVAAFASAANVTRPASAIADSRRPTKPTVSPSGTLARAWHEWWSERDRWFTRIVQTVLILVHFGCLWMFLSFHFTSRDAEGRRGISVRIGLPSPWFTHETDMEPNVPFRQQINLLSSSLLVATIGLLAYYVYWRIEKTKADSKLAVWSSPTAMLIVWATLAVAAIVLQLSIASSEGRRKPASKLGDPNAVIFDNVGPTPPVRIAVSTCGHDQRVGIMGRLV